MSGVKNRKNHPKFSAGFRIVINSKLTETETEIKKCFVG